MGRRPFTVTRVWNGFFFKWPFNFIAKVRQKRHPRVGAKQVQKVPTFATTLWGSIRLNFKATVRNRRRRWNRRLIQDNQLANDYFYGPEKAIKVCDVWFLRQIGFNFLLVTCEWLGPKLGNDRPVCTWSEYWMYPWPLASTLEYFVQYWLGSSDGWVHWHTFQSNRLPLIGW